MLHAPEPPSSPGDHSPDEVQQQQAEGAQVLWSHGVPLVLPSQPPVPLRRLTSPSGPGRPPHAGVSLAGPRRQVARPFLSCHFPGAPEPASSQAWANRRRGHHTRPPLRSQSARYTSPPRRRGQPIRQQNGRRGRRPMERENVRGSRRPEAPENRRELGAEKERAAVGNLNVHQSRGFFRIRTNCLREVRRWLPVWKLRHVHT